MVGSDIIGLEQVRLVILFLKNSLKLTFANLTSYTPECNSNFISLSVKRGRI